MANEDKKDFNTMLMDSKDKLMKSQAVFIQTLFRNLSWES